jgi:putative ABC transport system permease protein
MTWHVIRSLRSSPVVTAIAVLSLALGIGANTAVFSVINGLLLRPLPVSDPERLVTVSSDFALRHGFKAGTGISYGMWRQLEERLDAFEDGFAWSAASFDLSEGGELQPAPALIVSGGFFTTLGVRPLLGRPLTRADDVRGGGPDGPVVVISHRLWQRRFGGTPDVIGTPLLVDRVPCTIVGVAAPEFFGIEVGQPFDLVLPLGIDPLIRGPRISLHNPASMMLTVMLRLEMDQTLDAATAQLRGMQPAILNSAGFQGGNIPSHMKEPFVLVPAATGTSDRSGLRRQYQRPLVTILAVVALVLLIACGNIANLLLARATARKHELGVRLALGAPRWRLARQLLLESAVLAAAGTIAGVVFAMWASRALVTRLSNPDFPISLDLSLDWRVLGFTAAVAVLTTMVFGIRPAFLATRGAPVDALKSQVRTGGERLGVSSALIVAQVALSMVLLVTATLLVRTFTRLAGTPLGFDSGHVLVISVDTARAQPEELPPDMRIEYQHQLVDRIAAAPGVAHAAGSTITPLGAGSNSPLNQNPETLLQHWITPGWLSVYGMPLRAGRDLTRDDRAGAPRVVIVNDAYVRKYLSASTALGATVDTGPCRRNPCTIVGVVGNAVYGSIRGGMRPTIYVPLAQSAALGLPGRTSVKISVRSATSSPASLTAALGAVLRDADSNLTFSFQPLQDAVNQSIAQDRIVATLSAFFGGLALLLSALGLYGVTSYAVSRRRAEIGIRLALGASRRAVLKLVLFRISLLIGAGLAAGTAISLWAAKFLAALLFEVDPRETAVLLTAALILIAVGLFAGWVPAHRAAQIDPAEVLRIH